MHSEAKRTFSMARWTWANFAGWVLGVVFILLLSSLLDAAGIEHMQFYIGVGMGAGTGFTQWLYLRKRVPVNISWLTAAVLGMGIPFVLMDFVLPETALYKLLLCVMLGGIAAGAVQYVLLKKQVPGASRWIAGSFAGWTLSALTVLTVNFMMTMKSSGIMNLVLAGINLLVILAGGIVLGIVTGATLKKMLNAGKV